MGHRLKGIDEPVFMAVPKSLLTEFGIDHRLESCVTNWMLSRFISKSYFEFPFE